MKTVKSLRVPYGGKESDLRALAADELGVMPETIADLKILKKSLDARNRRQFYWEYTLAVYFKGEEIAPAFLPFEKISWRGPPPVIIGAGPAGLFAAWTFIQHGIKPVLIERGERTDRRMHKIGRYWRYGELDPESNVCFGEGGAGTFSDGKLITRIKNPLIERVMQVLVGYGAPEEISYVYNPHVGSNRIRTVIKNMSDDLLAKGGNLRFMTRVEDLMIKNLRVGGVRTGDGEEIETGAVILACGHSAGDLFNKIYRQGVFFEAKSFAVGLRIEHPQSVINKIQYGRENAPVELGPAQYKLNTYWDESEIGVYTFCMCPGGYVISSATKPGQIVVNGMSNYHRNSLWANSAVVCTVAKEKIAGDDPFRLFHFQKEIEKNAFDLSYESGGRGHRVPAQRVEDFMYGRVGRELSRPSCPSGVVSANLRSVLPQWMIEHLVHGLEYFDGKRRGFAHPDALLYAVESRTSSPVRITRNPESRESVNTRGLYPCGEGPGYAGGITSAAVDGMESALACIRENQK